MTAPALRRSIDWGRVRIGPTGRAAAVILPLSGAARPAVENYWVDPTTEQRMIRSAEQSGVAFRAAQGTRFIADSGEYHRTDVPSRAFSPAGTCGNPRENGTPPPNAII
jgi:hypothetical protein